VCPGRFSATYLLLLGIQRGSEAQVAAVDWILGKDWPVAADGAEALEDSANSGLEPTWGCTPAEHMDTSSMDTQQLLGHDAAEAIHLADTATSRAEQTPAHQARHVHRHAQQNPEEDDQGGGAAADGGGLAADEVRSLLHAFVVKSQKFSKVTGVEQLIGGLRRITQLSVVALRGALEELTGALSGVSSLP
jgi:hypothetical protein